MQNDLSVDPSSAAETGRDFFLQKKVGEYKKRYFFLMLTGGIILACVIVYVILLFSSNKNSYQPLDNKLTIGANVAVDSSGKTIAFPVYDLKDSTISIMVSVDSGRHFEQRGGPWKNINSFSDLIRSIQIAPDNKSIIAVGDEYIYLRAFNKDSFTCIKTTRFPNGSNYLMGSCFVPGTDSVYIYAEDGIFFCLNYKQYDSLSIAHLKGIDEVRSMAINNDKEIIVMSNNGFFHKGDQTGGIYINNLVAEINQYAVADYNNKADDVIKAIPTSVDTTRKMMVDTTMKMMADSTKK